MASSGAAAGLGLLSAATWGGSDFAGAWARAGPPPCLSPLRPDRLPSALLVLCFAPPAWPCRERAQLAYAAIGGFEGALALAVFYRALAMGAMGLTAALTGSSPRLVPVVFELIPFRLARTITLVGRCWPGRRSGRHLAHSRAPEDDGAARHALLASAASAGIGFGAQLILFKMPRAGGVLWALTSARVAGVVAHPLVVAIAPPKGPGGVSGCMGIVAGALDTIGNLFYIMASQLGRLDVAAVICSLYPAGTILLAGVLLRERPTTRQMAGMGLALALLRC